jgi:hypothetical protein
MIFIGDGKVRIATLCSGGDWSFVAAVLATKVYIYSVGDWRFFVTFLATKVPCFTVGDRSVVGTVLVAEILLTHY